MSPEKYKHVDFLDAMKILDPIRLVQLDTETMGLDCHTKDLLTLQLRNKENQVVFDLVNLSKEEKRQLIALLENPTKT